MKFGAAEKKKCATFCGGFFNFLWAKKNILKKNIVATAPKSCMKSSLFFLYIGKKIMKF